MELTPATAAIAAVAPFTYGLLSRIWYPAAEELGLWLKGEVGWRLKNVENICKSADEKLDANCELRCPPRLIAKTFEYGSWVEDHEIQDWWGGLLASSCTEDGEDDSNLVFTNLLGQLTVPQARIVRYGCEHAKPYLIAESALVSVSELVHVGIDDLVDIAGTKDFDRLDRELDHLTSLGLISDRGDPGGFNPAFGHDFAAITPTILALNLYVRCSGARTTLAEFFKLDAE